MKPGSEILTLARRKLEKKHSVFNIHAHFFSAQQHRQHQNYGLRMKFLFCFGLLFCASLLHAQERARLNVGIVLPLSGPLGPMGVELLNGARLAILEAKTQDPRIEEFINLIIEDGTSVPYKSREVAEQLLNQRKVDVLFGGLTSQESLTMADLVGDAKRAFLTPAATHLEVTKKNPYVFRSNLIDPEHGTMAATFVVDDLQYKRAAIIYDPNSQYSQQLMRTFEHRFQKRGGQIVLKETINENDQSHFGSRIEALRRVSPQIIFMPVDYHIATPFLQAARQSNLTAPFMGGETWNSAAFFKTLQKNSVRGHFFITTYMNTSEEKNSASFAERYEQQYRKKPQYYAAMGYDGMATLIDAYARAKGHVATAMVRSIATTQNAPGVLGEISLNRFRNAMKPAMVFQITASGPKYHSLVKAQP